MKYFDGLIFKCYVTANWNKRRKGRQNGNQNSLWESFKEINTMRHGGFLRTSHEQRRRSSSIAAHPSLPLEGMTYPSTAAVTDPYRRHSSTSSLHGPGTAVPRERHLSGSICLAPSPTWSRRGSSSLTASPTGSRRVSSCLKAPPIIRRRSHSERPPLVKKFSSMNIELKRSRVIAIIFIICSCCLMVAALSYMFRHYLDINF